MSDLHSKIIAAAAKIELAPLGFQRRGRSRLWIADRGSWLNIVEFTPSRWSKSVSLMNAAHWVWVDAGFMSFDEVIPSNCHADFETEDQFERAAHEFAKVARANALALEERFPSFQDIADFVIERAQSSPDRMGASWWGYQAGIASGLIGKSEEANRFLLSLTDDRLLPRAAALLPLVSKPDVFRDKINVIVTAERATLKLKPIERPAF